MKTMLVTTITFRPSDRFRLMRRRSRAVYLALFASFLLAFRSQSQSVRNIPNAFVYDVASIRPFEVKDGAFQRSIFEPPHEGAFRATAVTVQVLLHFAYGDDADQIEGAPAWVSSDLYNVEAKADEQVDESLRKMSEAEAVQTKRQMLQELLQDRFHLKVHRVERAGTVYALELAKGGLKIKPDEASGSDQQFSSANKPRMHVDGQSLVFEHMSLDDIANLLSQLGRQKVVNEAGVSGRYTFTINYQRDGPAGPPTEGQSPFQGIEDGLASQAGIRLVTRKGKVSTLVIDDVERPSPN